MTADASLQRLRDAANALRASREDSDPLARAVADWLEETAHRAGYTNRDVDAANAHRVADAILEHAIPAVFRMGDRVEITGSIGGFEFAGRIAEMAGTLTQGGEPEYSFGVEVEGWPELAWRGPGEIRHADRGESLLESARRERLIGPHAAPGEDEPTHPGPGESCQDPACVKARAQHEAAADIQDLTYELFADEAPEPRLGDRGTCATPIGRGAEGTAPCGLEIVLRKERTVLMADGTDGHGQPGGQLVRVWRHTDVAIDHMHCAQLGGPA